MFGAKRVLKDFRLLVATLERLIRSGKSADTKSLQSAYKSVRTAVSAQKGRT